MTQPGRIMSHSCSSPKQDSSSTQDYGVTHSSTHGFRDHPDDVHPGQPDQGKSTEEYI